MPTPRNDQTQLTWFADAACASLGPNVFFPPENNLGSAAGGSKWFYDRARAVCDTCPVTQECLDEAMAHESTSDQTRHGMWGGLAPGERARLARRGKRSVA